MTAPARRPAAGPASARVSHRSALDGVRALAILGVMFVHAGVPGFKSGGLGVDLFFVLSGFLITTLLSMESAATGSIAYVPFMARRALRLMPAYFLYATFVTAMVWVWPGSVRSENGGWDATGLTMALWGYAINFVPKGGVWNGQDLTVHLWSLAVEQQYYLVWPLVFLALRARPKVLRAVAVILALAAMASFVATPDGLYKSAMLFTRGFSLLLASATALWVFHKPSLLGHTGFNRLTDIFGALLLVVVAVFPYWPGSHRDYTADAFLPLLVPLFALWIARLWTIQSTGALRRLLQQPALVYLGKISYGVYLYHEALRIAVWGLMKPAMSHWQPGIGFVMRVAVYLLLSVAVAALSYEFFEKRFLRLADRFRPPRVGAEVSRA